MDIARYCQHALFHKPPCTWKQLSKFPLWCLLLSLNNLFFLLFHMEVICVTSNILGSPFLSRVSICAEVWTRVLWESEQDSNRRKEGSHLSCDSPLSYKEEPSLHCIVLLTDLHSAARPLLFCTTEHLLFLILLFLESQHPPSKLYQIPWGAALPFPFSHCSFLFLNMFWPTFLLFCFSNLVPWPCWIR